jgi:DNA-binding transcriptional ArsR family regulator
VLRFRGPVHGEAAVTSPPRALVEHEGRLDVLCCLLDSQPSTLTAIAERMGKEQTAVAYLLRPLDLHGLVRKTGDRERGQPLYEACLDEQPAWVREAVEKHCSAKA